MKKTFRTVLASAFFAAGSANAAVNEPQSQPPEALNSNVNLSVVYNGVSFPCQELGRYLVSKEREDRIAKHGDGMEQVTVLAITGICAAEHVINNPKDAENLRPLIESAERILNGPKKEPGISPEQKPAPAPHKKQKPRYNGGSTTA